MMRTRRTRADAGPDCFEIGRLARVSIGAPPPPPFHTSRPRLFELLDGRRQITTVFGPAGFGKTTLVSGWLAEKANVENAAWIALDDDLGDGHLLVEQLLEAIRQIRPRACEVAYAMVHDPRVMGARAIFTSMLNDLARQPSRWTFVLDDYPTGDARLDELISFVCDGLPPNVDILILSRGEPSLPLGRWRVSQRLTEMGLADLRFTSHEARAYLTEAMNIRLDPRNLDLIESRVDGWAAGLQLSALWINGGKRGGADQVDAEAGENPLDVVAFDGRHRFVAEYLANEVLADQDEATRRFLIATSVVDRFTSSLCDAIVDGRDSGAMLDQLRRGALFVVALDDRQEWCRYHHLFRDFLRSHVDPRDVADIHRRASAWFENSGLPGEAVRHALASGDPERARALVRCNIDAQLAAGEFHQLLRWLLSLPEATIRADVELSAYKAWLLYLRGEPGEAEAFFDSVSNSGVDVGRSGPLLAFKAYLAINRGRIREAEASATAALKNLNGSRSFFNGLAMLLLGTAQRISGDRAGAISTLRGAVRLAEAHGNLMVRLEATSDLVPLKAAQGKLHEAARLCERAIEETGDAPRGLTTTGPLHIRLGQLLYELDERDRAQTTLDRGVELCDRLGNVNYVYLGKRHLARLAYAGGQTEKAYDLLREASRYADRAEHARQGALVNFVEAEFRLREGNVAAAANLVGEAAEQAAKATEFEQFVHIRLLLAQDRPRAADEALARIEAHARKDGRLGGVFSALLLRALSADIRGDKATAERRLIEALSLGAPAGYVRRLLDLGEPIRDVLRRVETRTSFAAQFLAGFDEQDEPESEPAANGLLTGAETHILELLSRGMSNRDIAESLGITVGTAKWHIHHIYQKLDVASRTAAVYRAREIRLIEG